MAHGLAITADEEIRGNGRVPSVIILSSPSISIVPLSLLVPIMPLTATGHAYLPDGMCDTPQPETPYPLWLTLVIFLGVFAILQWAWVNPEIPGLNG